MSTSRPPWRQHRRVEVDASLPTETGLLAAHRDGRIRVAMPLAAGSLRARRSRRSGKLVPRTSLRPQVSAVTVGGLSDE